MVPSADGASLQKNKPMQNFSIELSKRLSELSGHTTGEGYDADGSSLLNMRHYYVDSKDHGIMMVCGHRIKWGEDNDELKVICPAWQVEDLLRNIFKIVENFKEKGMWKDGKIIFIDEIVYEISCFIAFNSFDTAYQKIEEYLWSILT